MGIDTLKRLLSFVIFCLLQVLILNQIHLFGCVTPLLYVYFVLSFERNYPQWGILLWAFAMGLVLDTFTNTPGVATASLTLVGFLQPFLLRPFIPRDSADDLRPSIQELGVLRFFYYAFLMVFIYHLVFFTLEMFSFFNWIYWAESVVGSAVLTFLLIFFIENIRRKQ